MDHVAIELNGPNQSHTKKTGIGPNKAPHIARTAFSSRSGSGG